MREGTEAQHSSRWTMSKAAAQNPHLLKASPYEEITWMNLKNRETLLVWALARYFSYLLHGGDESGRQEAKPRLFF